MKEEHFNLNGYEATVLIPDRPNGKWLWKTEFFHAFDELEKELFEEGYTRVYYQISDKYGSPEAIELMHEFAEELLKRYTLEKQGYLIGFSRGGLYAFNFALKYPGYVKKVYLDSPVLDLRTWPNPKDDHDLFLQVMKEYHFNSLEEYENYGKYPVCLLKDYFDLKIPTLLVCGRDDSLVNHGKNSKKMIDCAVSNKIGYFDYFVKVGDAAHGGEHHPHSFGNVGIDLIYGCEAPHSFEVYSNKIIDSSPDNLAKVPSEAKIIEYFFK